MATLESSLYTAFEGSTTSSRGISYWPSTTHTPSRRKYLEIPIGQDFEVFELPLLAIQEFKNLVERGDDGKTSVIVAMLHTLNKIPRYKSLNRYMIDLVRADFGYNRLVKCEVQQNGSTVLYYATHGAVFDDHFNPLMLCSWVVGRVPNGQDAWKYRFIRPILRIDPQCFMEQRDAMQRWIVKKAPAAGFDSPLISPGYGFPAFIRNTASLTVEVGKYPFKLKVADVPSISTTNESLLQIAIDHIDEVIT